VTAAAKEFSVYLGNGGRLSGNKVEVINQYNLLARELQNASKETLRDIVGDDIIGSCRLESALSTTLGGTHIPVEAEQLQQLGFQAEQARNVKPGILRYLVARSCFAAQAVEYLQTLVDYALVDYSGDDGVETGGLGIGVNRGPPSAQTTASVEQPSSTTPAVGSHVCSFGIHCRSSHDPKLKLHSCKSSTCKNTVHHLCVNGYLGTDVPTDYTEQDSPYMCLACGRAQAVGNTRAANTASNMENGAESVVDGEEAEGLAEGAETSRPSSRKRGGNGPANQPAAKRTRHQSTSSGVARQPAPQASSAPQQLHTPGGPRPPPQSSGVARQPAPQASSAPQQLHTPGGPRPPPQSSGVARQPAPQASSAPQQQHTPPTTRGAHPLARSANSNAAAPTPLRQPQPTQAGGSRPPTRTAHSGPARQPTPLASPAPQTQQPISHTSGGPSRSARSTGSGASRGPALETRHGGGRPAAPTPSLQGGRRGSHGDEAPLAQSSGVDGDVPGDDRPGWTLEFDASRGRKVFKLLGGKGAVEESRTPSPGVLSSRQQRGNTSGIRQMQGRRKTRPPTRFDDDGSD